LGIYNSQSHKTSSDYRNNSYTKRCSRPSQRLYFYELC